MHVRARRRLQDALTAIRLKVPIAKVGLRLYANGERYLRERERLARLYPRELLESSVELALGCGFSLDRKSTRLNSSHLVISYAVFCLKKKMTGAPLPSPPK